MQLFVQSPFSNTPQIIDVDPSSSVSQLKARIQEKEFVDSANQSLLYRCKLLDDTRNLEDYGIQDGNFLQLNLRLYGGSESKVHPKTPLSKAQSLKQKKKKTVYELSMESALENIQSAENLLPPGIQDIEMLQAQFKQGSEERLQAAKFGESQTLTTHPGTVRGVSVSSGLKYLTSFCEKLVKVHDYETKQEVASYEAEEEDYIMEVVYEEHAEKHPDEPSDERPEQEEDKLRFVVTIKDDKFLRLMSFRSKKVIHQFPNEATDFIKSVCISKNRKYLVSGLGDGSIRVYDLVSRQLAHNFEKTHSVSTQALAISNNNRYLASGTDSGDMKIFDLESGQELYFFEGVHQSKIESIVFSKDDQFIISAGWWDKKIKVYDFLTKELVHTFEKVSDKFIECVSMSADGRYLLSAAMDGKIKVFDFETKHLLHTFTKAHNQGATVVFVTPDNQYVVSGSHDQTVKLSEVETKQRVSFIENYHKGIVNGVAVTNDGKSMISVGEDKVIRFYGLETKKQEECIKDAHNDRIICLAVTSDDRYIATGGLDRAIRVFELKSKEMIHEISKANEGAVSAIAISNDNRYMVSGCWSSGIKLFDFHSKQEIHYFKKAHNQSIKTLSISHDNRYIVSASDDRSVKIWDIPTLQLVHSFNELHEKSVVACLSNESKYLITASYDRSIKIFSFKTRELLAHQKDVHQKEITAIAITHDSKYLISASVDKSIKIFDLQNMVQLHHFQNASPYNFSCIAISNDAKHIVAGTFDNAACVYNFPYPQKGFVFPSSSKISPFISFGEYDQYFLNAPNDAALVQNMEMYKDLYFLPYNWTFLHLLAVFQPSQVCKSPSYHDLKVPLIVDYFGKTPLHYLIAHSHIDFSSVNFIMKYILDYLEDTEALTSNESTKIFDSLSTIFPFIISKINPASVNRLLKLSFSVPTLPYTETFPRFGQNDTKSCLSDTTVLTQEIKAKIHEEGQDQVSFKALKLNFDYNPLSNDMLNNVLTLNEITNEEYFRSRSISSLISHLWKTSKIFHGIIGLVFCALMTLISIYVGRGGRSEGLEIAILVLSILFIISELLQVAVLKTKYLSSIWNLTDTSFFLLVVATMGYQLSEGENELTRHWMLSMIIILGYIRLMSYLRLFTPTRNLIRIITTILFDMWGFITIIILIIVGFALIFLEFNRDMGYGDHLYETYGRLFGNYDDSEYSSSQKLFNAAILFFFSVVLLNLLVAIMGDSYGKVQESNLLADSKAKIEMILESTILMRFFVKSIRGPKQYILFCEPRSEEEEEEEDAQNNWEGGVTVLKKLIKQNEQKVKSMGQELRKTREEMRDNFQQVMDAIKQLQIQQSLDRSNDKQE